MFHFKHFSLYHDNSALKISTDAVLLAAVTPVDHVRKLLDIGCGCGVIAYCLAWKMQQKALQENAPEEKKLRANILRENVLQENIREEKDDQEIIGIDIDESSVGEALKNSEIFPKRSFQKIYFYQQSIQKFSKAYSEKFDLIVSNPPFFVDALKPNSPQKNISKHNDSLPFEDLTEAVCRLLAPDGRFFMILPANESERFERISQNQLFKFHQLLIQPTPSKPVNRIITGYRLLSAASTKTCPMAPAGGTETLCLRNADSSMSEAYRNLTEEYLLKFC
ncbi:MAG: methyltransferase domain-containing protein [Bacteroidales bacterium]|nr:methyltransferase domain-containing protein [Bacteroidales bacterium]